MFLNENSSIPCLYHREHHRLCRLRLKWLLRHMFVNNARICSRLHATERKMYQLINICKIKDYSCISNRKILLTNEFIIHQSLYFVKLHTNTHHRTEANRSIEIPSNIILVLLIFQTTIFV
jgi:hypothetical protein